MNAGKWVIVTMFGVGLAAAAAAWAYRYSQTDQAHAFWGTETATLIAQAPKADAVIFAPSEINRLPPSDVFVGVKDISIANGRLHIRHALLQDSTFDWESPNPPIPTEQEPYGIRFSHGNHSATLLISQDFNHIGLVGKPFATFKPAAAAEFASFFREQFPDHPWPRDTPQIDR